MSDGRFFAALRMTVQDAVILSAAKNLPSLMRNHHVIALCGTQHLSYQIVPLFVLTVSNVTFR